MKLHFYLITIALFLYNTVSFSQTVILEENFNSIVGTGGNDGSWSGTVAGSSLTSFGSWTLVKGFKASECLKLGTASAKGELTTPELSLLSGDAELTFTAGAWNAANEKTSMRLEIIGSGSLSQDSIPLIKGAFSNYSVSIIGGTPQTKIVFKGEATSNSRLFIDSIKVVSSIISDVPEIMTSQINGVYNESMDEIIMASNSPTAFTLIGSLPTGISFSTGVFSGTPLETGTFPINVTATNSVGSSASKAIVLTIDKASQFLSDTDDIILDINQASYTLPEKSSGNLDVFYAVLDTTVATVNANILEIQGMGVTEVIAFQPGNQYYKELEQSLLLVVLEDTPDCGIEDFSGISLPSSYQDGAFIGNNNVVWNFVECRNENLDANNSGIDGEAIMLRRVADGSRIYTSKIPTGIGSFSVKLYKGFTGAGNRQVELSVNGESKGVSAPFDDDNEHLFVVDSINVAGDVVIELKNIKSMQVIVDDIEWTCYSGSVDETVWDGITWSNGIPNNQLAAVIQEDFQTGGVLEAHSLEIDSGTTLVLDAGAELHVGDLTINGTLKVDSGAHILQRAGSVNQGTVQVDIETSPLKRLDYMMLGTPVDGQNMYSFSPETLNNRFYEYDTSSDSFVTGSIDSLSLFQVGKAYGIRTPNTFTTVPQVFKGSYRGMLNNDTIVVSMSNSGQGFNLIGNPYPSLLDLDVFFEENDHLDASAYVYINANSFNEATGTYQGNNYAVYNKLGAVSADNSSFVPSSVLGTAEGFIVKANSSIDVLFTNMMRASGTTTTSFFANTSTPADKFWLELKDIQSQGASQALIGYAEGATNYKDRLFDAAQLTQNTMSITTLIQGEPYVIQGRSYPFQNDDKLNLRVAIKQAGDYSIQIARAEGLFVENQSVYLIDKYLDTQVNISENAYEFSSEEGTVEDRFEIVYAEQSLSINEPLATRDGVNIFQKEGILTIHAEGEDLTRIEILTIGGARLFDSGKLQQSGYEVDCSFYAKGVYLVKIGVDGKQRVIRKIIL